MLINKKSKNIKFLRNEIFEFKVAFLTVLIVQFRSVLTLATFLLIKSIYLTDSVHIDFFTNQNFWRTELELK